MTDDEQFDAVAEAIEKALERECPTAENRHVFATLMVLAFDRLHEERCPGCRKQRIEGLRALLDDFEREHTPGKHVH